MTSDILNSIIQAIALIITLDPEVMQITFLSLRVSSIAVILSSLIGIPTGIYLGLWHFRGKRILLTLINTAMAFPPVVMGLFIFILFSEHGPFGQVGILLTDTAMILVQLLLALPIIIGLSASTMSNVDSKLLETATTLGANQRQRFKLLIRETRVELFAAAIVAFGAAISEIGAVLIVGGNIRFKTRTLTTAIGREISAGRWEFALALGFILLLTAFLVNVFLTYLQHSQRIIWRAD
ncbi:MAG: ABC transporter permease [Candidatus Hodarchaeales archaeon]|jgi:tungstate transport system permease protein